MNERLKQARLARGIRSQREAARVFGLSPTHWRQLETGIRRPSINVAQRLARTFGIPTDELFPPDDAPEPNRPASGE